MFSRILQLTINLSRELESEPVCDPKETQVKLDKKAIIGN